MLSRVISLYKKVYSEIERSSSGRSRFYMILSFFTECEKTFRSTPPFSLIKDFVAILIEVVLKSDITFTDPSKLNATKFILKESKFEYAPAKGGEIVLSQIDKAIDIINMQMLKSYFYLGKYDDGLIVLNNMLNERDAAQSADEIGAADHKKKKDVRNATPNKYALVNPDIFKESRAYEILTEIKNELERLNSYSDEHVNILLVEQDGLEASNSNGTIQGLLCSTLKKKINEVNVIFENITDLEDYSLENALTDIVTASNQIVNQLSGKTVSQNIKRNLRFQNIKVVYKGASFGLGAAVISACNYFKNTNSRRRFKISNAVAFTGAIDGKGKVLKVNSDSINNKIEAAFFSWIKYCVVPKENLDDATKAYEKLRALYPTKEMKIICVENAGEVFEHKELFLTEKLNLKNYTQILINKYRYTSAAILVLITSVLVFVMAAKFLPKDKKPMPNISSKMSLVYTPDRNNKWVFQNADYFWGDTIDFGEVAVGDQWLPMLEFWNNSQKEESFDVKVEGNDDFELLWFDEEQQPSSPDKINPSFQQRLNIKFSPMAESDSIRARVIFGCSDNKEETKTIFIKAVSKKYEGGYSAVIKNGDDRILITPGRNIFPKEFTISFWLKPDTALLNNNDDETYYKDKGFQVLRISNDNSSLTKFALLLERDSSLSFFINNRKADFKNFFTIKADSKVRFGEWNYVCISYDLNNVFLTLNDKTNKEYVDKDIIRQTNDVIFFGSRHPVFDDNRHPQKMNGFFKIFNFKIYEKYFDGDNINRLKYKSPEWNDEGIVLNYEFDQMSEKKVFDLSKSDIWAITSGGVVRSLDIPDGFKQSEPYSNKETGNAVLHREKTGRMEFYKNIFKGVKNFTIQMDVKYDNIGEKKQEFYIILNPEKEYFLSINKDSLFLFSGKYKSKEKYQKNGELKSDGKWHRYTLTYEDGITKVYADSIEIMKLNTSGKSLDIEKLNYGLVFGNVAYIASARHYGDACMFDNVRVYGRAINASEIYGTNGNGLLAEWTFDNIKGYYAYDNIKGYPALLKGEIKIIKRQDK